MIDQHTLATLDLPASTLRNFIRLAHVVHPDNGHVALTLDHLGDLFGNVAHGTVRAHLGKMQTAGLIVYTTRNGWLFITLVDWDAEKLYGQQAPAHEAQRAPEPQKSTPPRAKNTPEDLEKSRVGARKNDHPRAIPAPIRNKEGRKDLDPTDHYKNPSFQKAEDRRRSTAMLTSAQIAFNLTTAVDISARIPADTVFRYCCDYILDRSAGLVSKPGALLYRLTHPEEFPPPPILPAWAALEFFQRYSTETNQAAAAPAAKNYTPSDYAEIIRT